VCYATPVKTAWLALGILAGVVGCAGSSSTASTAITAANVPATTSEPAPPVAKADDVSTLSASPGPEAPPGQLACRAKVPLEGTIELYLTWKDGAADGVLRKITASGMAYDQKVHAEKYHGLLIVDEPHSMDLVVHAAVIREDGKIKVGEGWGSCSS
jgi:hypothetical protein